MSLVDNERTKLLANALDRASTACFTVGVATPLAGYLYGVISFSSPIGFWLVFTAAGWMTATASLHMLARQVLKGLKP
ncbi:MAG: hypothetical protein IBJ07_03765 [Rhizobiaceae bacterium]|nr:hypothetical protein [Rhizobiaceae bacterium]